jgi:hypothetical protein
MTNSTNGRLRLEASFELLCSKSGLCLVAYIGFSRELVGVTVVDCRPERPLVLELSKSCPPSDVAFSPNGSVDGVEKSRDTDIDGCEGI